MTVTLRALDVHLIIELQISVVADNDIMTNWREVDE